MKNKLKRIISSLLILAFLISMLTVFASASEGGAAGEGEKQEAEVELLINRTFDEGWDFYNGFSDNSKDNNFFIDYEQDSSYNYNYFFRLEVTNGQNAFAQYTPSGTEEARTGSTILELSLKADDVANLGNIIQLYTSVDKATVPALDIVNNELIAFKHSSYPTPYTLGKLENEWVDIMYIFDWDNHEVTIGSTATELADISDEDQIGKYTYTKTLDLKPYFRKDSEESKDGGIKWMRLGFPASTSRNGTSLEDSIGMSYCVDNFKLYNSSLPELYDIPDNQYGVKVNVDADKTVVIQSGSGNKSVAQLLEEALCMKVGVDYALVRDEKQTIFTSNKTGKEYGAPAIVNGEIMIPLQLLLDYIDFPYYLHPDNLSFDITTGTSVTYITVGRDNAKVDDTRVELAAAPDYVVNDNGDSYLAIALADLETLFPGWLYTYDDMGLIIIYEDTTPDNKEDNEEIVNRDDNLGVMLDLMKAFIFDVVVAEKPDAGFIATGNKVYNEAKAYTNDFTHPYIYVNQEKFDDLKAAFMLDEDDEGYDPTLNSYISLRILTAKSKLTQYANISGTTYEGLKFKPVNSHLEKSEDPKHENDKITSDGYDPDGGRLNIIGEYTNFLENIAFAYQITGEQMYVDFAYEWMSELVTWEHWGAGHFLNAAEGASHFAVAYDWLYNAFKASGYDTDALADGFFELTLHDGYVAAMGRPCEHPRNAGDGSRYSTSNSNWNAVCTSGMITAALATFGFLDDEGRSVMFDETIYLVGNNLTNLPKYGLDEYAPDGSYIESATYWAYGTNYFFYLVMALDSSTGKDYGLMDTWGIDKTCYYACQITSSDGIIWNYHDGGGQNGRMDSSVFNFVGQYLGDDGLIALRKQHIERGFANSSLYDILYYPMDKDNGDEDVSLPLDYYMQGIQGFVSRDSWENGALYTGIMGGANNANHGNIDSGNFIYHNKGIIWFMDLGSEEYNVYGYFASDRYKYYRANGEGQNIIIAADDDNLMYGQHSSGDGKIVSTFSNEHGSYAILDNKTAYSTTVSEAKRGIFVTNDRQTVVIQDQITVSKTAATYHWIAHTTCDIEISEDGRTAYLKGKNSEGQEYVLRASISAQRTSLKFEELDTNSFLLDSVHDSTYSQSKGGVAELSRTGIKRLVVTCENTNIFNIAVVIEVVDMVDSATPVGYKYKDMSQWSREENLPSAPVIGGATATVRERADKSIVNPRNTLVGTYFKRKTAFTNELDELYIALSDVGYVFKDPRFDPKKDQSLIKPNLLHKEQIGVYDNYRDFMEAIIESSNTMAKALIGIDVTPESDGNETQD